MLLLAPIVALTHTIFIARLFLLRRGTAWNSQARQSHAVPWRLAFAKLWPQTLAGCTILGVVALKSPGDFGFALMGTSGLILAAPFAVATASPFMGSLFAHIGIARIPEEYEHPEALLPLSLPAIEINCGAKEIEKVMLETLKTVRGIARSLRIYYGDREHGPALDGLYREFVKAGRSRLRRRRARR